MTTIKYKGASPYVLPRPSAPVEDYLYKLFEDRVSLNTKKGGSRVLNVAIFGVGRAGTIHLSTLASSRRVKILYIVDDLEHKWDKIQEFWLLHDTTFLRSKESSIVFDDPKVDAVIITSPTFTHEKLICESLKSRKEIFCEKPLTSSYEKSLKCYEAAKAAGRTLFCAFNRRFDPSYAAARERVTKGEIGHIQLIKLVTRGSPLASLDYIKNSGGIYHDLVSHVIDLMIWFVGEFPTRVSVQAYAHIPEIKAAGDHDVVAATFQFPSGTLGIIDVARNCNYGTDQRLEVFGPNGLITVHSERPMYSVESQIGLNGPNMAPNYYNFASRYHYAYQREMEHFFDILTLSEKPLINYKETLAVSKIATAAEKSARSGNMVDIEWSKDELPEKSISLDDD